MFTLLSTGFKNTRQPRNVFHVFHVTLETHIQYIAYISFTLIFFPHQIIFSES